MAIVSGPITKEGRLEVPLYHGTSSLFFESIQEHGLGAKNPIEELGVIKTLERVITLAEVQLKHDDNYAGREWFYQNLLEQKSEHHNWQHGQVYVSISKALANQYANHPYGSELIRETITLYTLLKDNSSLDHTENPILDLIGKNYKPLVFKIENYPISSLQTERAENKSVEEILQMIFEADDIGFKLYSNGFNFRLIDPIPFSELQLVEVVLSE
jgi:hypothetical protein